MRSPNAPTIVTTLNYKQRLAHAQAQKITQTEFEGLMTRQPRVFAATVRRLPKTVQFVGAMLLAAACTLARAGDADSSAARSGKTASGDPSAFTLRHSAGPCGRCSVAVTPNFRIFWCAPENDLRELAERCERLAAASKESWL